MKFPTIKHCELFLAGGFVRDKVMGFKPKDEDYVVVTKMSFPQLIKEIEKIGRIYTYQEEFFTIRCRLEGRDIDLVFPRNESGYIDNRHPDNVDRVETLEEDSARRDFTINSMYMNKHEKIIDYHGGLAHIELKIIKTVGESDERFKEDALRILRAVRFCIKYNFLIESKTFSSMKNNLWRLKTISMERIKDELNKCLLISPQKTIKMFSELPGIYDVLARQGLHFELSNKQR